jgi:hypothetical protein
MSEIMLAGMLIGAVQTTIVLVFLYYFVIRPLLNELKDILESLARNR